MLTLWGIHFDRVAYNTSISIRWVGLCYAISQGFLTKLFMRYTGDDPTNLILLCLGFLSLGRVLAMMTSSLAAVYLLMALVIIALGVVNTAMASACARLADADEVFSLICYAMPNYCEGWRSLWYHGGSGEPCRIYRPSFRWSSLQHGKEHSIDVSCSPLHRGVHRRSLVLSKIHRLLKKGQV